MLLTKYDPRNKLLNYLNRDFNEFDSMLENFMERESGLLNTDFMPSVNTREGESAYHVEVDLPGVNKENISVDIKDNVLTITGNRESKTETKDENYFKVESEYGKFERSFTLPENTDSENIHAESDNGVLEVTIPKLEVEEVGKKRIAVT